MMNFTDWMSFDSDGARYLKTGDLIEIRYSDYIVIRGYFIRENENTHHNMGTIHKMEIINVFDNGVGRTPERLENAGSDRMYCNIPSDYISKATNRYMFIGNDLYRIEDDDFII